MKQKIVPVKNIARLREAGDALIQRMPGLPGMGLIWGPTGYGKTTGTTWMVNQCHGVYVRALALWSPQMMLRAIARELDVDTRGVSNGVIVELIIRRLAETGRPLFIDEADYVVEKKGLTNTLRDIHDLSAAPIVLVGMHGIEKRIRHNEQFTGRIAQWVEFAGLDMEDASLMARVLPDIEIKPDLVQALHDKASAHNAGAEIRRLVIGLNQIEGYAKSTGRQSIALADWPKGRDFFVGAPVRIGGGN